MIREIAEKHLLEYQSLLEQIQSVAFSDELAFSDLAELWSRADAHREALFSQSEDFFDWIIPMLSGDDRAAVCAAAHLLLMSNTQHAEHVAEALRDPAEIQLEAIRIALCLGPIGGIEQQLRELQLHEMATVSTVVAEALAMHTTSKPEVAADHFMSENRGVRWSAWRIAALNITRESVQ